MSIVLFMSMLHFLDFVTVSLVQSSMFTVGVIELKILLFLVKVSQCLQTFLCVFDRLE